MWDQADWDSSEDLTLTSPSEISDSNVCLAPHLSQRKSTLYALYPVGCVPPHLLTKPKDRRSASGGPDTAKAHLSPSAGNVNKRRTLMLLPRRDEPENGQDSILRNKRLSIIRTHVTGNNSSHENQHPESRVCESTNWDTSPNKAIEEVEPKIQNNRLLKPNPKNNKTEESITNSSSSKKNKRLSFAQFLKQKLHISGPGSNSYNISNCRQESMNCEKKSSNNQSKKASHLKKSFSRESLQSPLSTLASQTINLTTPSTLRTPRKTITPSILLLPEESTEVLR